VDSLPKTASRKVPLMRSPSLLILSWTVVFLIPPGRCSAGSAEVERFRAEYPAAARRWADHWASLQGRCLLTSQGPQKGKAVHSAIFAAGGGWKKVTVTPETKPPGELPAIEHVYCKGPNQSFSLMRLAGKTEYEIDDISWDPKDYDDYTRDFGRFLTAPSSVAGTSVLDCGDRADYRLRSVEPDRADPSLLLLDFVWDTRGTPYRAAVLLDPANAWAIRRTELYVANLPSPMYRAEVDYQGTLNGLPLPKNVRVRDLDGLVYLFEFQEARTDEVAPSEFTMAYYGLPEQSAPPKRPRGRGWTPWAGAAVIGLVLAWLLRRLAARLR